MDKNNGEVSNWANQLTEICSRYSGNDFYVAELLPQRKLKNAIEAYPIPGGGAVMALIDATLFGSAENGMIIGERGISWHNDLMTKSKLTSMSWVDFSTKEVQRDGYDIIIGEGNKFGMSGSSFDKDKAVELLKAIQSKIKKPNTNSAELEKPIENKQHLLKTHSVNNGATKKNSEVSDWANQLIEICSQYSADDYYVAEQIPQSKLESAIKNYPILGGGTVIALINTTLLGTAEDGMIIGERGISWHNDWWKNSSTIRSMSWGDFSTKEIKRGTFLYSSSIIIGEGNEFNMKASRFNKDITVELLKAIQSKIKKDNTNSVEFEKPIEDKQHLLKKDVVNNRATQKNSKVSDWANQLIKICSQYSGDDYYVADLIPQRKLKNAMETYPIPGGGAVIALIDATLLGSAENGMIIDERGISWHNALGHKSKLTLMNWEDFSTKEIMVCGDFISSSIIIGEGNEFDMSGSRFNKDKTVELLKAIQLKIKKANSVEFEKSIENKQHLLKEDSVNNRTTQKLGKVSDWVKQLTEVCSWYAANDYYVAELIPPRKLKNVMETYPIAGGGAVVALIDATLLGSAENGMIIGERGIRWHNDLGHNSKLTSMNWGDFSTINIKREDDDIIIGEGNRFNMAGSSFDKDITVELLKAIQLKIKTPSTNSVGLEKSIENEQHLLKKDSVHKRATKKTSEASVWVNQLTKICSQYSGDNYDITELIPPKKLKIAMETYPIPGGGSVIALIDTTLLGSAKNGMIIGERGISWHSGVMNGFRLTAMSWDKFSTKNIKRDGVDIIIGEGNEFGMSGSHFDIDKTVELLIAIQSKIKKPNTNSAELEKPIENKQHLLKTHSVNNGATKKNSEVSDWANQLIEICSQYRGSDYYVGGLIPQRKLEGAMKTYPIPGDGVVIALFDTTLLGSAEDGMIIGERGISWHNSTMGFRLTAMSWDTFSTKEIKHNDNDIIIGEGNKFDMGGTIIENDKAVELLTDIQLQIKKINTNSVEFKKFTNDKIEKNIFPGSIKYLTKELIPNQLAVGKAYRFTGEIVAVNDSSEDEIVIKLCNFKHEMEIDVHVSFVFDNR